MSQSAKLKSSSPRYVQVAESLKELINDGTLEPGVKVPSLRTISKAEGIAVATALQAYRLLEDQGVLEARPKSGYFVCGRHSIGRPAPGKSRSSKRARSVAVSGSLIKLLDHASNPQMAPLGCAIPSAELLAANKVDRFMSRAARQFGQQHNVYSTPQGESTLRQAIAKRSIHQGFPVSSEDIVITNGCTEALVLALKAVTTAGDTVLVESPAYFGVLQVLESLQLKALEVSATSESGIQIDALKLALNSNNVKACLLASSINNPLGSCLSIDAKHRILDLLWEHSVVLIEDDIYGDLHFSQNRPLPFSALKPKGQVIYCSSFSKTIAPGYRVGWIVPGRYLQTTLENKMAQSMCCAVLPQIAIAEYLSEGGYDNHLRRVRRVFQSNIHKMRQVIESSFPTNVKVTDPSGGFVLWLEMSRGSLASDLLERSLQENICFAPGNLFSTSKQFDNCLRLSCGHSWNNAIEKAVYTLGQLAHTE